MLSQTGKYSLMGVGQWISNQIIIIINNQAIVCSKRHVRNNAFFSSEYNFRNVIFKGISCLAGNPEGK